MNYKKDFPIFQHRPELVYLDNAATSQKPQSVLDREITFYEDLNSNIHRSVHYLAEEATIAYEKGREAVADFIGANKKHEIIFTRNATESINLVARSYGDAFLNEGDEVLISTLEHHSNTVPWLQLKKRKGIKVSYLDIDENGQFIFDESRITDKTKLVSLTGMSNALGTVTNIKPIIKAAHAKSAKVLIDACQLAVHYPIDIEELDADFLVLSAHKMYGPTGVGVLYGKEDILEQMPPFLGGGEMIQEVFKDHFIPAGLPAKFEAGTPNVAGVVTFKSAINYLHKIGPEEIIKTEQKLTQYTLKKLKALPYLTIIGPQDTENRGPVISFVMKGVHPHDIAEGLSSKHVCIRSGHHCCQILMDNWNLPSTARISLAIYNTKDDIDQAISALEKTYHYFNS